MKLKIMILLTVILFYACPALAEQATSIANAAPANPWGDCSQEVLLTTLEINHGLWLEAELAGHRDQVTRIENDLLVLLNCDIYAHQERVRQLARALILSPESQADTADGHPAADSLSRQLVFRTEISALNAKEALHRSMEKTDAFSNKYRLLGDYIDLLRRELKMPRLKLASSKALPAESKMQPTVSPREDNP